MLLFEEFGGAFRSFFDEKAHARMGCFDVRLKAERADALGSGRANGGDDETLETTANFVLDFQVGGDLEEMGDLHGGSKKDYVKFSHGDGTSGLAKRFDVFRERPLINGNGGDVGTALPESGEKFWRGDAVFLHGDLEILDWMGRFDFIIEDAKNFAPGVGFGCDERRVDA
jgi:hypothetical protein